MNAHLTAHAAKCHERIKDWKHIVRTLLFPPLPLHPSQLDSPYPARSNRPTTIYHTSHLFFAGDLNFRLDIPKGHALRDGNPESSRTPLLSPASLPESLSSQSFSARILNLINTSDGREYLKDLDELRIERQKGTVCQSLREPPFWTFKCTYKYKIGTIDLYKLVYFFIRFFPFFYGYFFSMKRIPAWTDRVLYTTYHDTPENGAETSKITPLVYTSVPSYTTSDHKPIVALLVVPPTVPSPESSISSFIPLIPMSSSIAELTPDPYASIKRWTGKYTGRVVGFIWYLFVLVGLGNTAIGVGNVIIGLGMWGWGRKALCSTSGLWRSSVGRVADNSNAILGEVRPNV